MVETVRATTDREARDVAEDVLAALLGETCASGGALYSEAGLVLAGRASRGSGVRCECALAPNFRLVLDDAQCAPSPGALRLAGLALGSAAEVAAQRERAARLEAQAGATREITRATCSVPVLDELLTLISERCRELLGCEVVGFALLEERAETIVWRTMCGCRTETHRRVTYHPGDGVAGRAISSGGPVVVHDFLTDGGIDPREFPISFAEGLRSVVGVPLEIDERPRGCLMIGYRSVHDFTSAEIDTLTSFSLQAAIAVENAQLYERVGRERARLESVVQSINEGLVLLDLDDRVVYANRQTCALFQTSSKVLIGATCEELVARLAASSSNPEKTLAKLSLLGELPAEFPSQDLEIAAVPPLHVRLTHFYVYDSVGERLGRGYLCRDVTFETQVDVMKTEVIAHVSHEIKTPLASIRGYATALLDESRHRNRALELDYLKMIDTESARLDDLVRNLTDVSKLEAGVLYLEKHDIDPRYVVGSVISRWRKTHPERRFDVACSEKIAPIHIDRRRVAQVLDNILSNAVKYSPPDSTISIALTDRTDAVAFSIADRGIGIPRAQRERVFERYYRVHGRRAEGDGSGLGLFISRGIVAAHGGEMSLESRVGVGTTVAFALPKQAAPSA